MIKLFLLIQLCIYPIHLFSQRTREKQPFSLEHFTLFFPSTPLGDIEKIHQKGEESKSINEGIILKHYIVENVNIWIQIKDEYVIDFYARLPTHFSHDYFHQFLIKRYGKQNSYFKQNRSAIYEWKDKNGDDIIYSGQCTLTCFPHYLSIVSRQESREITNLLQFFSDRELMPRE